MTERKVINKYFPPDYDPSKIKRRGRKAQNRSQTSVRLMAPYSMCCTRCREYIGRGKKFHARKETAEETYLGITIYRFYIKCPVCSSEITFKTDPKQADYIAEHGATRNAENWEENKDAGLMPSAEADDGEEDEGDMIADLEASQEQTRRAMAMEDELANLRQRNARALDAGALLALHETADAARRQAEGAADDAVVVRHFWKSSVKIDRDYKAGTDEGAAGSAPLVIKRAVAVTKSYDSSPAVPPSADKRKRTEKQKTLGIKSKKAKRDA